jgi:signal transduction histidine kinase
MAEEKIIGRALIADDDEAWAGVCQTALRRLGYETETAFSRKKALEIVDKSAFFDFALVDLNFPAEEDGRAAIYGITQRSPETDAILMTATPTLGSAIEILREGASDYIIKPFTEEYLSTILERCRIARAARKELDVANRLREELKAAYEELQETERLKDAFLSRVSHELNTPLTYISMAVGLLEEQMKKRDDPDLDRNIGRAREGVDGLQNTINDLLAFVDLQKSDLDFVRRPFDLGVLLDGVVQKHRRLAGAKDLPLKLEAATGMRVEGDALLLERAFGQLITNALNFNQEGGSVEVIARAKGDWYTIRIVDRGQGIPADKIGRIFESFYQAADYLTREVGGLGLGLSITKRIVEAHGGVIGVESEAGKGTTVKVELPGASAEPTRVVKNPPRNSE